MIQTEKIKNTSGYLYCLYNPMYSNLGENVYKLGQSQNIEKRLKTYTTYYVESCELKLKTNLLQNRFIAEKVLFNKLDKYRLVNKREFFSCDLSIIKNVFDNIEYHTAEYIKSDENECNKIDNIINVKINKNKSNKTNNIIINNKNQIMENYNNFIKNNFEDFNKEIISENNFERHLNLYLLINLDNIIKSKIKINIFNESFNSRFNKIKYFKELGEILAISFEKLDKSISKKFNNNIDNKWLADNLSTIIKVFRFSEEKYNTTEYYQIYQMYISMLTSLFDKKIINKPITVVINKIKYRYYVINKELYKNHLNLINKCPINKLFSIDFFD